MDIDTVLLELTKLVLAYREKAYNVDEVVAEVQQLFRDIYKTKY